MKLDKIALIMVIIFGTLIAAVYIAALVMVGSLHFGPLGLLLLLPVAAAAYILFRVIRDRLTNKEDDHYDRIER